MATERMRDDIVRLVAAVVLSALVLFVAVSIAQLQVLKLVAVPFLLPGALLAMLFGASSGSGTIGIYLVNYLWILALLYLVPKLVAKRRKQREQE